MEIDIGADIRLPESGPRDVRVLMANEPRAYREAIAQVIDQMRPGVEVITVEPAELDDSVRRLAPEVVICTQATEVVRRDVEIWVELYPEYEARSVASVRGRREEFAEVQLADLLSLVDEAQGSAG